MGIPVEELQHVRLNGHLLIFEVGGCKRVVRVGSNAQHGHSCQDENEKFTFQAASCVE
jgi:hypothetical protein